MKVAVTGYNGRLGSELVRVGCIPLECDVLDGEETFKQISHMAPDFIIHAAAVTDVDGCEVQETYKRATSIAVRGTDNLMCSSARVIYISSDYVFSGKRGPYDEKGVPQPLQGYGLTKWAGEITLLSRGRPGDCVVRTTGLYGGCSGKHDFFRLVLDALSEFRSLNVTTSLVANQTYVPHLVEGLLALTDLHRCPRIVNIASRDLMSRYDFAKKIARTFGLDQEFLVPVKRVNGWVAERPRKAGLNTQTARRLGLPIYTIQDGLDRMREVCAQRS